MIFDRSEQNPGARFLLMAASGVVVIFGLQFASPILLPFALALFLAILSLPLVLGMVRRGLPAPIAIFVALVVVVGVFGLLILLAGQSLPELQLKIPRYAPALQNRVGGVIETLEDWFDRPIGALVANPLLDPQRIVGYAQETLAASARLVSQTFLVLLIMVFVLSEATVFPAKLRALSGGSPRGEERMTKIVVEIQSYLGIKTMISLLTGLLLGLFCWYMELDFPVLLGLVAFALNYIPTVGSIIAAVPAVVLSVILHGTVAHAFGVTAGYVAVNTIFGNLIEPSLMGRRLGLSPLVVVLSLVFWYFVWGPLGALLSVPLTMIVKIWLENTQDLRWLAVLIDKQAPDAAVVVAAPATASGVPPDDIAPDAGRPSRA